MQNAIIAAITAVANIRNVEVSIIMQEMRDGNQFVLDEVFKMSCAAAAIQ